MAAINDPREYIVDVDRNTGELISGLDRIKQSMLVILTTLLKTRLMRLWWGSDFLAMQDKPGNQETIFRGILAATRAINAYEPEFKVRSISVDALGPDGVIAITVDGVDLVQRARKGVRLTLA